MTQKTAKASTAEKSGSTVWLFILIAAVPILLIALYYISNGRKDVMDWVGANIAAPYRDAAGYITSFGPFRYFSLAEILISLLVLWVLFHIVKTIILLVIRPHRLYVLGRRVFTLAVVALYIFAAYTWLWGEGYHSTDLAEKTGLDPSGVTTAQLINVTELFAGKASALSTEVERDAEGHFSENKDYYFELSKGVYTNIANQFPALSGPAFTPKAMIYSKLMSVTGFTGVYIALTGETNINVDAPAALIPATIAHEMAHQRGVNSEEEANFSGIAACITSNITVYEYSGYLMGLMYLTDALNKADPEACDRITATLHQNVRTDWKDNSDYWEKFQSPAATAVSAIYDGYLKSNGVTLGVQSYGACVDMLAAWLGNAN
ncbi:Protein of unknown function [Sporobacter termitidis DSM 10068]|uniref:DUF3810 domain-containing protein n=1 Tax=Sporobacter termitidis DSM 10068 TaxID=1123282 RepID=A0A1M5Y513_9FIRM|nr:DUF3810 domain-containing protein [Sporobacter termitidis]SHI07137.1 Protein of unknown function [Sporobacter termitidis DSM 10068]